MSRMSPPPQPFSIEQEDARLKGVLLQAALRIKWDRQIPFGEYWERLRNHVLPVSTPESPPPEKQEQKRQYRAGQGAEGAELSPLLAPRSPDAVEGLYRDRAIVLLGEMEEAAECGDLNAASQLTWDLQCISSRVCPHWWREVIYDRAAGAWEILKEGMQV